MSSGSDQFDGRIPAWSTVAGLLQQQHPQLVSLDGSPAIELIVDGRTKNLHLRCAVPDPVVVDELDAPSSMQITAVQDDDEEWWLEIEVDDAELLPYFLSFCATVADSAQLEAVPILDAVRRSFRLFRRLLRELAGLPREREIGFIGELWFLQALHDVAGLDALKAWTATDDEAHDFRIGRLEVEVKTTTTNERSHWIHGLGQLKASPSADLRLLSVHLTSPGAAAGFSLSSLVEDLRERFRDLGQEDAFVTTFQGYSGVMVGDDLSMERYKHRAQPALISVDEPGFPKLVPDDLALIPRPGLDRVDRVDYSINVEGLGVDAGTDAFNAVLSEELGR